MSGGEMRLHLDPWALGTPWGHAMPLPSNLEVQLAREPLTCEFSPLDSKRKKTPWGAGCLPPLGWKVARESALGVYSKTPPAN